jgi:hypothetical protein
VRAEWAIVCTVHNLLKLAQRRSLSEALAQQKNQQALPSPDSPASPYQPG